MDTVQPPETMLVPTKPCPRCGRSTELTVPVEGYTAWKQGRALIQVALPDLTDDQREMLMTGYDNECWDALFPPDDDEQED